jgi:hypothetical protein
VEIKNVMRTKQQTIEKWWNGLLPVEKWLAYWAMRALKHADDAGAVAITRDVQEMNRTVVRFFKKRQRQERKLQEAARAERGVTAHWN